MMRAAAGLVVLLSAGVIRAAEEPRWLDDLDRAQSLARKTGRPLFVVFRCEH
jgi:hypothetical protein